MYRVWLSLLHHTLPKQPFKVNLMGKPLKLYLSCSEFTVPKSPWVPVVAVSGLLGALKKPVSFCETILFKSDYICSKSVFLVQSRNTERYYQVQHIWISLGTKFHFNQTVMLFWTKFIRKGSFQPNRENLKIPFSQHFPISLSTKISF